MAPTATPYRTQLLALRTGGSSDPDAIRAALAEMATPGHPWEMFSAAGNAACSAALTALLAEVDDLTEETLVPRVGAAIGAVAAAGHHEVGDTEPETCFEDAANLIALLRGWGEVSRFSFVAHYGPVIDEDRRIREESHAAAVERLIAAHADEFDRYVAEETSRRR